MPVCSHRRSGTASFVHVDGARNGPSILPFTSKATSSPMLCQCSLTLLLLRRSLVTRMLSTRNWSIGVGVSYFVSERSRHPSPGVTCPRRSKPSSKSCQPRRSSCGGQLERGLALRSCVDASYVWPQACQPVLGFPSVVPHHDYDLFSDGFLDAGLLFSI